MIPAIRCTTAPSRCPIAARHEAMWREDGLYDLVVVIGYNIDPPVPGAGQRDLSACRAARFSPTAGCIAIARDVAGRVAGAARARQHDHDPATAARASGIGPQRSVARMRARRQHGSRRRDPDGSDRHDQYRRRFDLRAGARGAGARARAVPLPAAGADPARRAALRPRAHARSLPPARQPSPLRRFRGARPRRVRRRS